MESTEVLIIHAGSNMRFEPCEPFDPEFGAPVTPRLRYRRYRFDGILVAIDAQVGHMGGLNNIFVSSHPIIDSVTFLLRMILAKISHVNEFYHLG